MKHKIKAHERVLMYYSNPNNAFFVDEEISSVEVEKSFRELFHIRSEKTPDIVYFLENEDIIVGEVKGSQTWRNIYKAKEQAMNYKRILVRNDIPAKYFTAVGLNYVEIEGKAYFM